MKTRLPRLSIMLLIGLVVMLQEKPLSYISGSI